LRDEVVLVLVLETMTGGGSGSHLALSIFRKNKLEQSLK
jgi:hypothetical protein